MAVSLPLTARAAVQCCVTSLRSYTARPAGHLNRPTPICVSLNSAVNHESLFAFWNVTRHEPRITAATRSIEKTVAALQASSPTRRYMHAPSPWHLIPAISYRQQRAIHSTAPRAQQPPKPSNGNENTSLLVRSLMRAVPHPVAVITSTDTTLIPEASSTSSISKAWKGATVSSFNTVSLDPEPIVSFNVKRLSSTYDALSRSGYFNVHLMSEGVAAEKIATRFAGGNAAAPFDAEEQEQERGQHNGTGEQRKLAEFVSEAMVEISAQNPSTPPVIVQRLGQEDVVAFRFLCQYLGDKTVSIGDSVVVFGRPVDVEHSNPPSAGNEASCLSYVHGRYSQIAK